MIELTRDDVRARLAQAVEDAGSQGAFARRAGVSATFLSDVLHGRREITDKIVAALDLRRIERFVSTRGTL